MESQHVASGRGQSVRQDVRQEGRPEAILIEAPSRLLAGHGYLAWSAFPGVADAAARERALDALAYLTARLLPRHERPAELRDLPRDQKINSALRPIQRRLNSARLAGLIASDLAWHRGRTDDDWTRETLHYACTRAGAMVPMRAYERGYDVETRIWRQHLASIHLCIPLSLATLPAKAKLGIAERHPELVPLLMPDSFAELVTSDAWVLQALDVAERWRQALPVMCPGQAELRALPPVDSRWL